MDLLHVAFLPNLGMTELIILGFLGLLIFGKKLPEVGKSLGQGIVSFKKGLQGMETDVRSAMDDADKPRKKKKKKVAALEGDAAMESVETAPPVDMPADDHSATH